LARLNEAQATLAKLDATLDAATAMMRSIEQTSQGVNDLVKGDGAALVADARRTTASADQAISALNRVMADDLPAIIADVRAASAGVNAVVARVGNDISGVTGKLDGIATDAGAAIGAATETFRTANDALAKVTATMSVADGALESAQQTFASANRIMDEDVGAIVADMRTSMANLNVALSQVSADLPEITQEVRATLARAATVADSLDGIVNDNAGQIDAFMKSGLPQFVRFVQEGNRLLVNLQRLTDKIERDPARFLLGTQSPEFRR
jgi:phospholipid/cholesterol/gamma-HCH transport system substrate-binding protein